MCHDLVQFVNSVQPVSVVKFNPSSVMKHVSHLALQLPTLGYSWTQRSMIEGMSVCTHLYKLSTSESTWFVVVLMYVVTFISKPLSFLVEFSKVHCLVLLVFTSFHTLLVFYPKKTPLILVMAILFVFC